MAHLAFDNEAQLKTGNYKIAGTVYLATEVRSTAEVGYKDGIAAGMTSIVRTTLLGNPSDTRCARVGEGCRSDRVLAVGGVWMSNEQLTAPTVQQAIGPLGHLTIEY